MQNDPTNAWLEQFAGAVTVCDADGILLAMNDAAAAAYASFGGRKLLGTNLLDCHPEPSRSVFRDMLATRRTNVYTVEREGRRKLVYQSPWFEQGEYRGLVEIVLPLPEHMPHFVRDAAPPAT